VRRLIALIAALLVIALASPRAARAEVWIESYEVDVAPDAAGKNAHFQLKLVYRTSGEVKKDGFKFVGKSQPTNLRARGSAGPARGTANLEPSSREWKLDFEVPPDGTVFLDFDQSLNVVEGGWGGARASVDWAPNFKVRVDRTVYRVAGGPRTESTTPGSLTFPLGEGNLTRTLTEVVITLLALGAAIGVLVLRIRAKKRELLATRGIVPPVPEVAYPEGTYRAPPPIVKQGVTPEPVLAPEDEKELRTLAVSRIAMVVLTLGIVAFSKPPIRIGFAEAGAAIIATVFALLSTKDAKSTVFAAIPVAMALMLVFAGPIAAAAGAIIGTIIGAIALAPKGTGGGSSSSSSCSSGSSCGGGGGGCGGGGGGGGCGG